MSDMEIALRQQLDSVTADLENMKILLADKERAFQQQRESRMALMQTNSEIVRTFDQFLTWAVESSILEEDEEVGVGIISNLIENGVLNDPFCATVDFSVDIRMKMSDTVSVKVRRDADMDEVLSSLRDAISYAMNDSGSFDEDSILVNGVEYPITYAGTLNTYHADMSVEVDQD